MTEDLEALESLVTHPGWRAFTDHVTQEWGPNGVQFTAELDRALNLTDNDAAASQARQIRSGQKVIAALLAWPQQAIAQAKRQAEMPEPVLTRGGYRR